MPLSGKQRKWIARHKAALSIDQMARELNVPKDEIKEILKSSGHPVSFVFYMVAALVPVIFFVVLELGLRIFNYGYDYTQWVSPIKGKYMLNPQIARKYFHDIQDIPRSNADLFDIVKKPNAFRVFVLGESAAAGYPFLPNGSFSRYLQERLSLKYPHSKIEVVNCAMTAINSYAMLDFIHGILEEKPDLIIVYAGNNEYYGALGVGSMETFGTSRTLVNLTIYLERFRTYQLIRNMLKNIAGAFGKSRVATGTLMARMARNQYIPLGSKVYREGLSQFAGNMGDVLRMAKEDHVPVILGTLASNLKDQRPFVSVAYHGLPPADTIFAMAGRELAEKKFEEADSLYRFAKDLDALRFRAPTALNEEIFKMGAEFGDPVVNIDSAFDALSPDHIVGDNLMTDHLHPTLRGYQIMGRLYYEAMEKCDYLPNTIPSGLTDRQQDSISVANFPFAKLDSVIGEYRIKVLKDDWPYIKPEDALPFRTLLHPSNYIDSLAYQLVENRMDWVTVHKEAAQYYAFRDEYGPFVRVMNSLIGQYPYEPGYYDYAVTVLMHAGLYGDAYHFLEGRNGLGPDAFTEKWLGIIDLADNRIASAEKHLTASLKYNESDPQVWYNLAGVYVNEKNYPQALKAVERTISLQSDFPGALALRDQLQRAVR